MDFAVTTEIDPARCNGCGRCVTVCPSGTISMVDGVARVTGRESLGCGHCEAACPTGAVRVRNLDPAMLRFETFRPDPRWLAPGKADLPGLGRLMASRRSCRNYKADPVDRATLRDLVRLGCTAPSGTNCQPWTYTILPTRSAVEALGRRIRRFFERLDALAGNPVVRTAERVFGKGQLAAYWRDYAPRVREKLDEVRRTGSDPLFHGAPAAILVAAGPGSTPAEDALLTTQNILLAAHAMGLGTCLVGFAVEAIHHDPAIGRELGLAPDEKVRAVIAVGYPAERYQGFAGRRAAPIRWFEGP